MKRLLGVLTLALILILAMTTSAFAVDEPAGDISEQTPTTDGTTSAPSNTATSDPSVAQADAADGQVTTPCVGLRSSSHVFNANNVSVTIRRCVQYSTITHLKRLKVRATCRSISTGALTTCHFWWSQDPRGHTATYRMLYQQGISWFIYAYSSVRSPALNAYESVAYSQWGRDFNGSTVNIQGQLRNLGITLHGGTYAYPFSGITSVVQDTGSI